MTILGIVFIVLTGIMFAWAMCVACEGCDAPEGEPIMESIGLARSRAVHADRTARSVARRHGVRLGRAPNQGTRLARFRVLARAGLGSDALMLADALMRGAQWWKDASGWIHLMGDRVARA